MSSRIASSSNPTVYYGEIKCQNSKCKNKAYWLSNGNYLCGIHSRYHEKIALPKNPDAEQRIAVLMDTIYKDALQAGEASIAAGDVAGSIFTRKLRMMKPIPMEDGCFTILPNRKAVSKYDVVLTMPALSPMVLGPVIHNQPGLEPALTLENFHQFNKVFASEVNEKGDPLPVWKRRQKRGYADPVPHRYKLGSTKEEHLKAAHTGDDADACLYSIFAGKKYSYVQSRVFYCTYYERLARQTVELATLASMLYDKHQSIIIAGYDARDIPVNAGVTDEMVESWYYGESQPFGYEMILHAILYFWYAPEELPWRKAAAEMGIEL